MTQRFPDEHELLAFFEAEPKVQSPNSPWFYNELRWDITRDGVDLRCCIRPAEGSFGLTLLTNDISILDLRITNIIDVSYEIHNGDELLLCTTRNAERFTMRMRPTIHIGWDTERD